VDEREDRIRTLLPLVRRISRRVHALVPRAEIGDLLGDGYVGLVRAVDAFDPTRGASLQTYVGRVILSAMLNGLRRLDPVPERVRRVVRQGDVRSKRYARAAAVLHRATPVSLDAPLPEGERGPIDRGADPAVIVSERDERANLRALVDGLPERQRRLVLAHYYGRASLRRISVAFNVSPQRASQLHMSAIQRLRKAANASPT
jgi:RNA polymerase sigma factor for flagellar operon FliA